ncbi:MAG: helix-turn-helix domain-containing protein [Chitinophagales bacterium]
MNEEIELLNLLIEKWDSEHNSFHDLDPVQLLKSLMEDHNIKPISLAELLGVSKGLVSDILNYKKGLSKDIIRKLSDTFKLSHEAFNRHYDLIASINGKHTHSKAATSRRRIAV